LKHYTETGTVDRNGVLNDQEDLALLRKSSGSGGVVTGSKGKKTATLSIPTFAIDDNIGTDCL
jgi:hypothetical protein